MRWALLVVLVACGGGGGGGGDDAPTDDAGGSGTVDATPETPLNVHLTVKSVTTPAGVRSGVGNYRIWGSSQLRIAPVFTQPLADCTTLVGYTTGAGARTARVAHLDANDNLLTTYNLGTYEIRGLAAEPDGHWAALLWDGAQELFVIRYDKTGAPGWTASLDDPLAVPDDFYIGEARFAFGSGSYGAYYHVHGISGFANGHEGDQFKWIDATAGTVTTEWQWGCSHSMSNALRYDGANFLSACVTDCYPGTSGSFATESIGGIYLDHDVEKVMDVDGACNGSVAGELGSLTPGLTGEWKMTFNAHQQPATKGQSSYSSATMNQDIGFVPITGNRQAGTVVWLTTTPGNEANSSIARWEPDGDDREQYVVGWSAGASYILARVNADGSVGSQVDVAAMAKWGDRDDPFRVDPNKDVVWAWFDTVGATSFSFARLDSRRTGTCAPF